MKAGRLKELQGMMDKRKYFVARDRKGATPLHNAILYEQTEIIRYIAVTAPHVLNAPDYVSAFLDLT